MLRHVVRGLIVALLLFPVATAAPATAQTNGGCSAESGQYPPSSGTLETSSSTVPPGGSVTVSGCGFRPGSSVAITLAGTRLATVTVGPDGGFRTTVTIPDGTDPGTYTLRATGTTPTGETRVLSAALQVVDDDARGGDLPRTGSSSTTPLVAAGVGMVLLGSAAVVVARRRRLTTADS